MFLCTFNLRIVCVYSNKQVVRDVYFIPCLFLCTFNLKNVCKQQTCESYKMIHPDCDTIARVRTVGIVCVWVLQLKCVWIFGALRSGSHPLQSDIWRANNRPFGSLPLSPVNASIHSCAWLSTTFFYDQFHYQSQSRSLTHTVPDDPSVSCGLACRQDAQGNHTCCNSVSFPAAFVIHMRPVIKESPNFLCTCITQLTSPYAIFLLIYICRYTYF